MDPYEAPKKIEPPSSKTEGKAPRDRYPLAHISALYLFVGCISLLGFLSFFLNWGFPRWCMLPGIFFYLATLTFTIWIHPIASLAYFFVRLRQGKLRPRHIVHAILSITLASIFTYCVFVLDFIITA